MSDDVTAETDAVPHHRVVIVGAGFSGIAMAVRLREAGIEDLVILEKAHDVGGTWRDNRYPGCACDVPSRLYSLSFAPKATWSRDFASAGEIWDYLRECVDRFDLRRCLRTGVDVSSARWTGDRWQVAAADGRRWTAGALVLGVGGLHVPVWPDLPGLHDFAGNVVHTADWPDGLDLTGRRVGVIGTGASAVQLVPAIVDEVEHLTVFQRTPSWIVPRHDQPWGAARQRLFARWPITQRLARLRTYAKLEVRVLGFGRLERLRPIVERQILERLARAVPDEATRRALTPDYALGCKRVLLSDDYWPTFARPHVVLETDPIVGVDPGGIVTSAGSRHDLDVLVIATGFDPGGSFERLDVRGQDGKTLGADWVAAGRPTHFGVTVAGLPELYLLLGPNTALGHSSVVLQIESAVRYAVSAILRAERVGPSVVTERAQQRFAAWLRRRTRYTVWASGCRSWYLDSQGRNVTIWPASTVRYRWATRRARPEDFEPAAPRQPS
ncbi:MAG: NAD(P)/FAD-dependent oxidoreductase [Dermatophilaceae bacterium]